MISAMLALDTTIVSLSVSSSQAAHDVFIANNVLLGQSQWVFVAFTFLFFDVFSLGILPVSWMYASEIMPLRTRNKGVALGAASHWLSNFVVVYVTPQAIESLGYRLYVIWAILNASFVPITWLFYPETARRSLEDMDAVFLSERFEITRTRSPGNRIDAEHDLATVRE